MIYDLFSAFRQLTDLRLIKLLAMCGVAVAAMWFAGLALLAVWLQSGVSVFATGALANFDWVFDVIGGVIGVTLMWMLFFPTLSFFLGVFCLERVAQVTESNLSPRPVPTRVVGVRETILSSLRFLFTVIMWNIIALPFYLIPMVNLVVAVMLNGYLISREYFDLAAARFMAPSAAKEFRQSMAPRLWWAGMLAYSISLVPFINLFTPLIATGFMVSFFHRHYAQRRGDIL